MNKIRSALTALGNLLEPLDSTPAPWARQVAKKLQDIALSVFTRKQPLTADTATTIRIAALCLAVEADTRKANQPGDTFREIAAGVTLLERRANGQAAPTETIMLAIT